jgi:hypothetical protein
LGRFSEPGLVILISLAEGAKHGYEMMLDIERAFGHRLGRARCTAPLRASRLERLTVMARIGRARLSRA